GMGEVYRAEDTNLKREVAIKVLPEQFTKDPQRLARFEREAQLLASLNHPNIAAIYSFEHADGLHFLVLELVEGETLAERVTKGPLPVEEALEVCRQIAEGVEAAHEKGVIHRDLKPANVKVTPEGKVKILDFGLAKAFEAEVPVTDISQLPTLTEEMTRAGVILGTPAYMSPEQARGKIVDKRTDIWAFGCVLYEMLTGRRPFEGEEITDVVARIIERDPDFAVLPRATPPSIRRLLRHALQKDRKRRLADIADALIDIADARSEPETPSLAVAPSLRGREYVWAAVALVALLTTAALAIRAWLAPVSEAVTVQFEVFPPEGTSWPGAGWRPVLSPDGRTLAFVALSESKPLIWTRPLDSAPAQPLLSTEGTESIIFWSPDSQWIGFSAEGKLKKVAVTGGPSQVLADLPTMNRYSGTWSSAGVILLGKDRFGAGNPPDSPLFRVSATGGQPAPATELDANGKEQWHLFPNFLPDGQHYLYVAATGSTKPAQGTITGAYVGRLDSQERHLLPGIRSEVKYASTGHLLFTRDGALMAQPFDLDRLELAGEAFPIVDPFATSYAPTAAFSVSMTNSLAYKVSETRGTNSELAWFDRSGKQLGVVGLNGAYGTPALSPDGKFVAFNRGLPADIWILEIPNGRTSRITFDPERDTNPVWSPDGQTIAFRSFRDGQVNVYQRAVGVVGEAKPLLTSDARKELLDWSPDGRFLAFGSAFDLWALPLFGDSNPVRVTATPFNEGNPRISPDGRWIAYESDESGTPGREVYIQSFPEPGPKYRVSTRGGTQPVWSRDGKELFYIGAGSTLMSVPIKPSGSSLEVGSPTPLFETRLAPDHRSYDVSADGRFLLNVIAADLIAPITVILNWKPKP
ncbi:protein kinase, partial [Acidobacteria bacterium AH-259-L09]|nr:protein kinase [Acidobacteria bacterium AH-259-L09]